MSLCRRYLDRDILTLKPKVIVPLGNDSLKVFIPGSQDISNIHGEFFKIEIWGNAQNIMPTYHPHFLIKNSNKLDKNNFASYDLEVKDDLVKALNIASYAD